MQNRRRAIVALLILLAPLSIGAQERPPLSIRQLSNEVYRLSQEMITHGSEGHAHEIASYGEEMIGRTEALLQQIESSASPEVKKKKGKIVPLLKETLKRAKEAVRLAEQEKAGPALDASRKASFRAKQAREQIQTIP